MEMISQSNWDCLNSRQYFEFKEIPRQLSSTIYQSQIEKLMGPTWDPPGSCRPQMGPMLAPLTLVSGLQWPKTFVYPPYTILSTFQESCTWITFCNDLPVLMKQSRKVWHNGIRRLCFRVLFNQNKAKPNKTVFPFIGRTAPSTVIPSSYIYIYQTNELFLVFSLFVCICIGLFWQLTSCVWKGYNMKVAFGKNTFILRCMWCIQI